MMYLRSILAKAAAKLLQHGWWLKLPVMLLLVLVANAAQVQFGKAAIVSEAVGVATYEGLPVTSAPARHSIDVVAGNATYQLSVVGVLDDLDGDGLGDVGETINYTYTFRNTGNLTLTNLKLTEAFAGIFAIACGPDGEADIDNLVPSASAVCTVSHVITLPDLLQDSIDTAAMPKAYGVNGISVVIEDNTANDNTTTTPLEQLNQMKLRKQAGVPQMVFPNIYQYEYVIEIENTGTIVQSNIGLRDDLQGAVTAPGRMISASVVDMEDFSGTGTLNGGFDGVGNSQLFSGDVQLAPGKTGLVRLQIRVDTAGEPFLALNSAFVTSSSITTPVPSDDPNETPDNFDDINPASVFILDSDRDGVNNNEESDSGDEDGDGIPNIDDFDPTGYLYCETGGRILTGGLISVRNLTTSGTQTGVGSSNNITIVKDGSDGQYRFYVNRAGAYRLSVVDPPFSSPPLSTSHLPGPMLDVTGLSSNNQTGNQAVNQAVLGSYAGGSPVVLVDDKPASNPYYFDFQIDEFDPVIFNNNIPFAFCGDPEIAASQSIVDGPTQQADGKNTIIYRLSAKNTGTLYARDVQISDTLAAIYGAGNYTISSIKLDGAPANFGAKINPDYDGDANSNLLDIGGQLNAGQMVSVLVEVLVNVAAGNYTNRIVVNATNPVSGNGIDPSSAEAGVIVLGLSGQQLVVSKTTGLVDAKIGQAVPFTITVKNDQSFPRNDVDIIDQMPANFTYVLGSAKLDGVAGEPVVFGKELIWSEVDIPANSTLFLKLTLLVGKDATARRFTNNAYVRRRDTRGLISNIANAVINLSIEPVFNCSDIVGRVYNDINGNGRFDESEDGVAGVQVTTVNGLLLTTDSFGRFHVACSEIFDSQIGSDFTVTLDERTLPDDFRMTSENPGLVRITPGKLNKIEFGTVKLQEIPLRLFDSSFSEGSNRLTPTALGSVARLLSVLEEKPSLLRLSYSTGKDGVSLARQRLQSVKSLVEAARRSGSQSYELVIETDIQQ